MEIDDNDSSTVPGRVLSPDEQMLEANASSSRQTSTSTLTPTMTGRPPKLLYLSCNPDSLNDYQCLVRKNMEFFEATPADLEKHVKGRNKPITLGM